jgi:uncharacterized integral membrane protein
MRIKTIIMIIITVLLTVVIMQNTDEVKFTLLFSDVYISKLVVLTAVSVIAFLLGILVGRPSRVKPIATYDDDIKTTNNNPNTLSDEDREYIS